MNSKKKIDTKYPNEILNFMKYFDEAEDYAKGKIAEEYQSKYFLGLSGIKCPEVVVDLDWFKFCFSSVKRPPGVIHICRAANLDTTDHLGVSRYSHLILNEVALIFVKSVLSETDFQPHDLLWHLVALIKLRGYNSIFCPAIASRSWNVIPAIEDNSVVFNLLDDYPRVIPKHSKLPVVDITDLEWVKHHYWDAMQIRDFKKSRRFSLAFNIAYTWNYQSDFRMSFASLWVGLETLFGERSDMKRTKNDNRSYSQKLSDRIAEWLEMPNSDRIRELYNLRNDALHGRWIDDTEVKPAIIETETILRKSLILAIERDKKTLPDWI